MSNISTKAPEKTTLAIDTSCDETAVAVVRGLSVLSNIIASQVELHKEYGGVFPTVAKQAHKENIDRCVALALKRARLTWNDINSIAVTQGPGLAPALEVGIRTAKQLAKQHGKPVIPINHIEGHVLSVLAQPNRRSSTPPVSKIVSKIDFPVLSLVISGGHSSLILVESIGNYERLGWTIDDAAGEALDKVGRMLGLGYPAGPVIEEFAKQGDEDRYEFPLPMTTSGDYNLSFSGLKTFARRKIEELEASGELDKQATYDFCASFQKAVFRHICHKLNKVLLDYQDLGQVWLGGGVAANIKLREMVRVELRNFAKAQRRKGRTKSVSPLKLITPYTKKLCGDNAVMIGIVGQFLENAGTEFDREPRLKIDS